MNRKTIKSALACGVAVGTLALTGTASADFRYDNRWMVSTPAMAKALVDYHYGVYDRGVMKRTYWARCYGDKTGDFSVDRNRGLYHHLYCVTYLRGTRTSAMLEVWQTGGGDGDFRVSDIQTYRN